MAERNIPLGPHRRLKMERIIHTTGCNRLEYDWIRWMYPFRRSVVGRRIESSPALASSIGSKEVLQLQTDGIVREVRTFIQDRRPLLVRATIWVGKEIFAWNSTNVMGRDTIPRSSHEISLYDPLTPWRHVSHGKE